MTTVDSRGESEGGRVTTTALTEFLSLDDESFRAGIAKLEERDRDRLRQFLRPVSGIEVGSVVELRSGSVLMTVTNITEGRGVDATTLCRCMFFADGKFGEVMVALAAIVWVKGST